MRGRRGRIEVVVLMLLVLIVLLSVGRRNRRLRLKRAVLPVTSQYVGHLNADRTLSAI